MIVVLIALILSMTFAAFLFLLAGRPLAARTASVFVAFFAAVATLPRVGNEDGCRRNRRGHRRLHDHDLPVTPLFTAMSPTMSVSTHFALGALLLLFRLPRRNEDRSWVSGNVIAMGDFRPGAETERTF
jgi:hypothetical protein